MRRIGWRDAGDVRPRTRMLALLLAALAIVVALPPAAGALRADDLPFPIHGPLIEGDPRVGGTLTCSPGTWDAEYEHEYQWATWAGLIPGADSPTYVVRPEDSGTELLCLVYANDGFPANASVHVREPEIRTRPQLSGDARLGGTLSCTRGTWDDRGLPPYPTSVHWERDGEPIEGAEGSTYVVTADDLGHGVTCVVVAAGTTPAASATALPQPPVNRVRPVVGGDLRIGGLASCSRGDWDDEGGPAYPTTYRWLRDGEPIELATAPTYEVSLLDAGHELSCRVVAGAVTAADSLPVAVRDPENRSLPRVSGDLRLGRALTCEPGAWDGNYAFEYTWLRGDEEVSAGAQRVNAAADIGEPIACRVRAHGRTSETSAPVYPTPPDARGLPALQGDPRLGRTLTCTPGDWDDEYPLAYAWLRDGEEIATGATYTLTAADVLHELRCRVTAAGLVSVNSRPAYPPQPRALTVPVISGDPRPGQTLSCSRGSWDDPETPYPVSYEWFRDGEPAGDGQTYAVAQSDVDAALHCAVTAAGLTTETSDPVTVSEPEPTSDPVNLTPPPLTGTPRLGGTLTCGTGTWNGNHEFAFRWLRDGTPIEGATQSSYAVAAADIGQPLRCEVSVGTVVAPSQTVVPTAPGVLGAPEITGDPAPRRTLRCSPGAWDGAYPLSYAWVQGEEVVGTTNELSLTAAHVGAELACRVTAGGLTSADSAPVTVAAPRNLIAPSVNGDARVGATLTCDTGAWDGPYTLTVTWLPGGETTPTRTVSAADVGQPLACEVRADGLAPATSAALTPSAPRNLLAPALSGSARVGGQLTCGDGTWDGAYAFTYAWSSGGEPIDGESEATYRVRAADTGKPVTCAVTAGGLTTAASNALVVEPPVNVRPPEIEGDRRIATTLTCSPGTWDAPGYAFSYRWLRDGEQVATGGTYTTVREDLGGELACEVTAAGLTTATSEPVEVTPPENIHPPQLTGAPQLRGSLTCTRGTWDDTPADRYSVTYQWYVDGEPEQGSTQPQRAISRDDLGKVVACGVTAEGLTEARAELEIRPPEPVDSPTVRGVPWVGHEIECDPGRWNDSEGLRYTITSRWRASVLDVGERPVVGGDRPTYRITPSDVGRSFFCEVTVEGEWTYETRWAHATWAPVAATITPFDDEVAPGAETGYTVTFRNTNPLAVTVSYYYVSLPAGFTYRPGTTTGAITTDPDVYEESLTFETPIVVPASGEVTFSFGVKASEELGDHWINIAWGPTVDYNVWLEDRYDTARITVAEPFDETTCTIRGTDGPDVLVGTPGDDVICGFGGDDVLQGGDGDDVLWGGPGSDRLDGGDGDDVLLGGDGDDILLDGAGADYASGGSGLDTFSYAARRTPVEVTLGDSGSGDGTPELFPEDTDGDGEDDTEYVPAEGDDLRADIEIVRGGRGDDLLRGTGGDEELYGGAGHDTIEGEGGYDLLDGGDGGDYLAAGWAELGARVFCGGDFDTADLRGQAHRAFGCELFLAQPEFSQAHKRGR
jgi:hypothetical protein